MKLSIVTPKGISFDGEVDYIVIDGDNGQLAILQNHIPIVVSIRYGFIKRVNNDSENYHKLIEKFTHDNERFLMMGGTNYTAEIERTLMGLGFSREDFNRPTSEFSGGWRMRIELAKLLLRRPDVLLLDEPTNHLDVDAKEALKQALIEYKGSILLICHEPEFYRDVVSQVWDCSKWTTKVL